MRSAVVTVSNGIVSQIYLDISYNISGMCDATQQNQTECDNYEALENKIFLSCHRQSADRGIQWDCLSVDLSICAR